MNRSDKLQMVAPELRDALDLFPELDFTNGVEAFRGNLAAYARAVPDGLALVHCEERFLPGADGHPPVRALLYTPPSTGAGARPAVLEIHGGGYVLGSADMSDASNRAMALEQDCVVLSVDYRLAPETPWPGALEDCHAALVWLHANADALGVDPARIAVAGASAGGGHAAALALCARDRGGPSLCFQLLDFPMLDDRTCTSEDPHPHCGHFVWTPEKNRFGWGALLGCEPGGADVPEHAVPARRQDLSGLPPACMVIGALDLFLEETLDYARRLVRAGVPVELHVIPGAYHGFGIAADAPQSRQAAGLRRDALTRALHSPADRE